MWPEEINIKKSSDFFLYNIIKICIPTFNNTTFFSVPNINVHKIQITLFFHSMFIHVAVFEKKKSELKRVLKKGRLKQRAIYKKTYNILLEVSFCRF